MPQLLDAYDMRLGRLMPGEALPDYVALLERKKTIILHLQQIAMSMNESVHASQAWRSGHRQPALTPAHPVKRRPCLTLPAAP